MFLLGCGTLYIIETGPNGLIPQTVFDWNDGLFDITWAENNENILVTGAGDGHVVVWDINQKRVKLKKLLHEAAWVYLVDLSLTRLTKWANLDLGGCFDK